MPDAERWQQIQEIYYAALERDPSDRTVFLDEACAGDEQLRSEVNSLLSCHDEASGFLASPAIEVAAKALAEEHPRPTGDKLGTYKLISLLGRGGMGEVYLAEDTRLGRKVALKLLDPSLITNPQLRARFFREAQLASALDHPNICTIHEIGEGEGRLFISMQYVEGRTLKQTIGNRALALDSFISIALQVADALSAAHERGIVHRDIKSTNIIITPRGQAKVLDFGLAKLIENIESRDDELTRTGAVMGTPSYMSPEQARGERADARSDIFSFGVVLYEMATGRLPFRGKSQAETMNAVINLPHKPANDLNRDTPLEIAAIIDCALAKQPSARYCSIKELIDELRRFASLSPSVSHRSGIPDGVVVPYVPATPKTFLSRLKQRAQGSITKSSMKKRVAIIVAVVLIVAAAAYWFLRRSANMKWARQQIPRIEELARARNFFEAYDLAMKVRDYLPDDPTIARLMPTISDTLSVTTEPSGARVYLKRFAPDENGNFPPRQLLGTTPIANQQIARGDYLVAIEKDGYAIVERTISGAPWKDLLGYIMPPPIKVESKLIESSKIPDRMVAVPGGDYRIVAWRRPTEARVRLNDYFIDKYEVTNREYKEFISAGGYLNKKYWKHPFVKDGRELSFEEAMHEFKDRTGLPGPRSWSGQDYPEGKANYPATDITWYEAAAYAEFRGKSLPSIFQWEKAARNGQAIHSGLTMPWGILETTDLRANFRSSGTMPVDSFEFGVSPFGCYNMAGNVSEWCLNEASNGFITSGGAWGDTPYLFGYYGAYPGFYNSNKLGFRCALNLPGAVGDQGGMKLRSEDEIPTYTPAPEATVRSWFKYYDYERAPLDAQVVEVKETNDWRREKVTFNGAGGERAIAYLYLPKNSQGPLQVIQVKPAGDVERRFRSLPDSIELNYTSFVKAGRAVFAVVLKGYIERDVPADAVAPNPETVEFLEEMANNVIDERRGLDYLETRGDIDMGRIALFTPSSTGFGHILAAVEQRYRTVALQGAAVRKYHLQWKPEVNPINFVPLIKAPKIQIHGLYDEAEPFKTEGEPLFKLLREPKKLVTFEGGHIPPPELFFPLMSAWLDEKMGPVRHD